jgi:hypothetical protein
MVATPVTVVGIGVVGRRGSWMNLATYSGVPGGHLCAIKDLVDGRLLAEIAEIGL